MKLNLIALVTLLPFLPVSAKSQPVLILAGYGYRLPANSITAAPGQILAVSILGLPYIGTDIDIPVMGPEGWPLAIRGLSVTLVQSSISKRLQLRGVQQMCGVSPKCPETTTLTVQMPYELEVGAPAILEFRHNEVLAATTTVKLVTDQVHILNSCDQTGVSGVSAAMCLPVVTHADGSLVSGIQPARPGERLVLWAFGMGAVDRDFQPECCSRPELVPVVRQPFTVGLFYTSGADQPFGRLASLIPLFAGAPWPGMYQVQFDVPPAPEDMAPCNGGSNLRILINGPSSADTADVCLAR
ncbi:MAG: hypothetical protein JNL98_11760 [Bryobacterales bacterium]|nr:hypothetical protein [Bryobacterales bacterium]